MRLTDLKGIGEKTEQLFSKLSVYTVQDLLALYPRAYDIYEACITADKIYEHEDKSNIAIEAVVFKNPSLVKVRNLQILSCEVKDVNGESIKLIWFNMPYLKKSLQPGYRYIFRGRPVFKGNHYEMEQPSIYTIDSYNKLLGVMQPIYPLTKGLSNKIVSKSVLQALEIRDFKEEFLPEDILKKYDLKDMNFTVSNIHFPKNNDDYEMARKRIVFNEFFLFILNIRLLKEHNEKSANTYLIENDSRTDQFIKNLSFELTNAQKNAWNEIKIDMKSELVMNRLIQGDVGSGKTIVAVLAMLNAVYAGYQAAMMVPTEVLAIQQYEDIKELFRKNNVDIEISLLIGSMTQSQKKQERERIKSKTAKIVIGTHALIQDKVEYNDLALVITDEQHRFGVHQREGLSNKGNIPHVMVMSATPIPRTLAMIIYGDLNISVINELPSNRLPIKNCVVDTNYRPNAYKFIEKQAKEGRQAYVICPMVEATKDGEITEDDLDGTYTETCMSKKLENVVDYASKLKEKLGADITVEYLHGKMKPALKNEIMERFNKGITKVLVSTTVIEVGVNVPNATVMLIENADRFGLAQLHQLRGRVGRGGYQSYCIFIATKNTSDKNRERLEVLNKSNDGFKIAEEDLKMRGPGDFFGIRQSGDMRFEMADIYQDSNILKEAANAVDYMLKKENCIEKDALLKLNDKYKIVL